MKGGFNLENSIFDSVLISHLLSFQSYPFEGICPGYLEPLKVPPTAGRNELNIFHIFLTGSRGLTSIISLHTYRGNYRRAILTACSSSII